MTWPVALLVLLVAFALSGCVCLVLIWYHWGSIGRVVSDLWAKLITKGIQYAAGAVSLGSTYAAATQKEEWFLPAAAGVVCVPLWEVVGLLVDNRVKATDRADKSALERAEQESELRTRLLAAFRRAVDTKAHRVRRQVERANQQLRVTQVRNALTPEPHLAELLQSLAVFFQEQLPVGTGRNSNFRVGVYADQGGVMTPVRSISLNDSSYTPFTSYEVHREAFSLTAGANRSLVVTCVRQKQMIVVEDCVKAEERGDFFFFREDQRSYLRSMVSYYLGQVCLENGTMSEGSLVVDTESAGFFKESERDSLDFYLRDFGARLRLEMLLIALLTPRRECP